MANKFVVKVREFASWELPSVWVTCFRVVKCAFVDNWIRLWFSLSDAWFPLFRAFGWLFLWPVYLFLELLLRFLLFVWRLFDGGGGSSE